MSLYVSHAFSAIATEWIYHKILQKWAPLTLNKKSYHHIIFACDEIHNVLIDAYTIFHKIWIFIKSRIKNSL